MTEHSKRPRPSHLVTAIALIVDEDKRFLISKRLSESGRGMYACPGGSIEQGEHPLDAAIREAREETGMTLTVGRLVGAGIGSNDVVAGWIALFYLFRAPNGVISVNLIPESQENWEWWPVDVPPQPMLPGMVTALSNLSVILDEQERVDRAIDLVMRHGMTDGGCHKQWLLDQTVRELTGELYGNFRDRMPGWDEGISP